MNKFKITSQFLAIIGLIIVLSGCTLNRSDDGESQIEAFSPSNGSSADFALQSSDAIVTFSPAEQSLQVGDAAIINVQVEQAENLFAVAMNLRFDPTVLQVQDANPEIEGIQIGLGDFPNPEEVSENRVIHSTGVIDYAAAQVSTDQPNKSEGLLATIAVEAVGPGTSDLTVVSIQLVNGNGDEIPTTTERGTISVQVDPNQSIATPTLEITSTVVITTTETPTTNVTPTGIVITSTPVITTSPTITATHTPTPEVTITPLPTPTPTNTPLPPNTQIPSGSTVGFCYRVQADDTLEGLATTYNTSVAAIQTTNDLYPPQYIYQNQALYIPTQLGSGPNLYVIEPGDTLNRVATACNLPEDFLSWTNTGSYQSTLDFTPGAVIEIPKPPFPPPSRYLYPRSGPFGPPSVSPPISYGTQPHYRTPSSYNQGNCDYVIQSGDTLYSIGRYYGISIEKLMSDNGITNADHIYAGQCLTLWW